MDLSQIYESSDHYNVLTTPYLMDDEGGEDCWDKDSFAVYLEEMKDEIPDFYEEYIDIREYDSLKEWWDDHYDPKGIACTTSYHNSLLEDVRDMISDYNESLKHHQGTPLKEITDVFNKDGEGFVVIKIDGEFQEEPDDVFTPDEILIDNMNYYFRGCPLYEINYDEEKHSIIMSWTNKALCCNGVYR